MSQDYMFKILTDVLDNLSIISSEDEKITNEVYTDRDQAKIKIGSLYLR